MGSWSSPVNLYRRRYFLSFMHRNKFMNLNTCLLTGVGFEGLIMFLGRGSLGGWVCGFRVSSGIKDRPLLSLILFVNKFELGLIKLHMGVNRQQERKSKTK